MDEVDEYVRTHQADRMTLADMWAETDRVWDSFGLDNRKPFENQPVAEFYSHPVWIVNGLFSAADPESLRHRAAIAQYAVRKLNVSSVADYGCGLGELARQIAIASEDAVRVDIIEPHPSKWGIEMAAAHPNVMFRSSFCDQYDLVVAQDVLEHTEDPIAVALKPDRGNSVRQTPDFCQLFLSSDQVPFAGNLLPQTYVSLCDECGGTRLRRQDRRRSSCGMLSPRQTDRPSSPE